MKSVISVVLGNYADGRASIRSFRLSDLAFGDPKNAFFLRRAAGRQSGRRLVGARVDTDVVLPI
jgi:hypothetical protein